MKERNDQPDRLDPLLRDAVGWIVRLRSGEATIADAEQLMDWRAKSPAHENAYRNAVRSWQAIGQALAGVPFSAVDGRRHSTKSTPSS